VDRGIQSSKEYFERFSKKTNFQRDTLEKAYRLAARDLYDIYTLQRERVKLDKTLLKKIFIFFSCLARRKNKEGKKEQNMASILFKGYQKI